MEFYYCFDWFVWEFGKCLLTPVSKLLSSIFTELHQVLKVCKRNSVQSLLETRKTSLSPHLEAGHSSLPVGYKLC